jgi:hypothetical protein
VKRVAIIFLVNNFFMITLEKLMTELKAESLNEIVAGGHSKGTGMGNNGKGKGWGKGGKHGMGGGSSTGNMHSMSTASTESHSC